MLIKGYGVAILLAFLVRSDTPLTYKKPSIIVTYNVHYRYSLYKIKTKCTLFAAQR